MIINFKYLLLILWFYNIKMNFNQLVLSILTLIYYYLKIFRIDGTISSNLIPNADISFKKKKNFNLLLINLCW